MGSLKTSGIVLRVLGFVKVLLSPVGGVAGGLRFNPGAFQHDVMMILTSQ